MIIDTHTHVTAAAGRGGATDERFPNAPVLNAPPEQLLAAMDAAGVDQAVVIQPSLYGFDHTELLHCLDAHHDRFVGIALACPGNHRFVRELDVLVERAPIRGIRIAPLIEPGLRWSDPEAEPLYDAAARLQLSVNLLITPTSLPVVDRWVARHPDLTVVIDHLARPDLDENRPGTVSDQLLRLARFDNVYVKVSALTKLSSHAYPHVDARQWVHTTVAEFGAARMMWGSDFPFTRDTRGYLRSRTVLDACYLTESDRAQLLFATAAAVYRVPTFVGGSTT